MAWRVGKFIEKFLISAYFLYSRVIVANFYLKEWSAIFILIKVYFLIQIE
jgi:hypothetical protein